MCVFQHIHWVGFWHASCFVSMFSGVYKCVDVMCIYIYILQLYIYTYIYMADILWLQQVYIWAPVKILYIWVVATVMVIAFGGCLSLSRVSWKSAYSWSNMKPKSIPEQARKWIEQLFCWFQALRQHFMFLSCCIHLHACSFMFLSCSFICICLPFIVHSFLSCSFHVPFIGIHVHSFSFFLIPMCIHVLSCSFHLHACSFHFAFMSFHFLSKVEMVLWLGQRTECNKGLSLSYR